ncbi:26 kDa periplasmic immunogenic protein [subsurface metagenome]
MSRKLWLVIGLVPVVICVGSMGCAGGFTFPESPQVVPGTSDIILSQQNSGIWVTGEGKVSVVPDVAVLNLGVETQEETVAEAQQQAAEAIEAVMNVLEDYGIAEKDIKTQYFSIYPVRRWENNREILLGYRVSNMVTVKIRQVDDTGVIIDAVAEAGGDYTRINSIGFTVDDPTDYYEQAREEAMADAEDKAKQLAHEARVTLGKPTYIHESGGYIPVPGDYYFRAEGVPSTEATTPISPGETEIQLTVQVVYSIE